MIELTTENIIKIICIYVSLAVSNSFGGCIFAHYVFNWKFKNKAKMFGFCGVFALILIIIQMYQTIFVRQDLIDNNLSVGVIISDGLLVLTYIAFLTLTVLNLEGKIWKRVVVIILCYDIETCLNTLIEYFLWVWKVREIVGFALYYVISLFSYAIFLLLLVFISSKFFSKRKTPVVFVFLSSILVNLLVSSFGYDTQLSEFMFMGRTIPVNNLSDKMDVTLYLGYAFGLFVFVFFVIAVIVDKNYFKSLAKMNSSNLESQARYYETIEENNKAIRSMRHDMRNHLTVLALLIEGKEYDKASQYINEMNDSLKSSDVEIKTGNSVADAVILDKCDKASKVGLDIKVEGLFSYKEMASIDVCTILSNILDNAIEALENTSVSSKVIELTFKATDSYFMISETNLSDKPLKMEDTEIKTTKKDKFNHGFGIENIRTSVSKYNGEVDITSNPVSGYTNEFQFEIDIIIPTVKSN